MLWHTQIYPKVIDCLSLEIDEASIATCYYKCPLIATLFPSIANECYSLDASYFSRTSSWEAKKNPFRSFNTASLYLFKRAASSGNAAGYVSRLSCLWSTCMCLCWMPVQGAVRCPPCNSVGSQRWLTTEQWNALLKYFLEQLNN